MRNEVAVCDWIISTFWKRLFPPPQLVSRSRVHISARSRLLCLGFQAVFQKLRNMLLSSSCLCPSVRPHAWNVSAPSARIFMKFDIWIFFENLYRKFDFHHYLTRVTGSLHEDRCTITTISRWIPRRIRNVPDEICKEYQIAHFIFTVFFSPKFCAVFEMWEIKLDLEWPQMILRRMRSV